MQHDTAALHPAAREKLLERWLWTEESMGSTTAREGKPPSPLNYPHCMAKDHSHCCQEEPKGMAAPWMAHSQKRPVVFSVLCLTADQWGPETPVWASLVTTCTLHSKSGSPSISWASPASAETEVSQEPTPRPTLHYCAAGRKPCPNPVHLFFRVER